MNRTLYLAPLCLFALACQSPTAPHHADRDPLRDLLAVPAADASAAVSDGNRQAIDALVLTSFAAPEPATRAAGAFAVADQRLAPLTNALVAIDQSISVAACNLANAETTAFKSSRAVSDPHGRPYFRLNCEQGSLENTGRQLDVAVSGDGFFKVKVAESIADGYAYTRNGNFFINRDGELTLGMGDDAYRLIPSISIPKGTTDITINQDGDIDVIRAGSKVKVGRLQLVKFVNPEFLSVIGSGMLTQTEASGAATTGRPGDAGFGQVLQGFLEGSNVDPTRERLRIRYLQNWRNTIMHAVDDAK
ncbi:MAG: flagellar basal-body rod protein FlgG [Phycisphaerales bacterium]|nr:flagellar basal-body rod protein FlgG [Phycisphaerales bacterium]